MTEHQPNPREPVHCPMKIIKRDMLTNTKTIAVNENGLLLCAKIPIIIISTC